MDLNWQEKELVLRKTDSHYAIWKIERKKV